MGGDGMTAASLPTHRDEAWRYSDIDAVAAAWPLPAPESIMVPAGGELRRAIVQDDGAIRHIEPTLGKGAGAQLPELNHACSYGRVRLHLTLPKGAVFGPRAAADCGGDPGT